ncbi:MAG: sterol desaturase family protein [Cyanobacteria bacterium SZAS-4]|nr:sterol desaturase family protein [Cyanobacteria bacterium SZAS-4]
MFEETKALTVPILVITLGCVAIELIISVKRDLKLYQPKDTLCNLFILLINRLSQPLFLGYIYGSLRLLEGLRLFTIPSNEITTVIALFLTDFIYYWEHRFSHKMKVLWFFHEVHHSSKQFNLTTSFRLHWFGRLIAPLVFAPLIIVGFRAEQVFLFFIINLFYQFFLHTKLIGKLGMLEGIINTPSAHRVHHARNLVYIDRNFGGILMIWDRLFGTYKAEVVQPKFGILGRFESNNPVTVQFHNLPFYHEVATALKSLPFVSAIISLVAIVALQQAAVAQTAVEAQTFATQSNNETVNDLPLKGAVQFSETPVVAPDFTGSWKGHVLEYHRHPKVEITAQNGNEVSGTYTGILGKFPLAGVIEPTAGTVQLSVDFSKSILARWKKRESVMAIFTGQLKDDVISGTATIPEFGSKMVHFQAKRLNKDGEMKTASAAGR